MCRSTDSRHQLAVMPGKSEPVPRELSPRTTNIQRKGVGSPRVKKPLREPRPGASRKVDRARRAKVVTIPAPPPDLPGVRSNRCSRKCLAACLRRRRRARGFSGSFASDGRRRCFAPPIPARRPGLTTLVEGAGLFNAHRPSGGRPGCHWRPYFMMAVIPAYRPSRVSSASFHLHRTDLTPAPAETSQGNCG